MTTVIVFQNNQTVTIEGTPLHYATYHGSEFPVGILDKGDQAVIEGTSIEDTYVLFSGETINKSDLEARGVKGVEQISFTPTPGVEIR